MQGLTFPPRILIQFIRDVGLCFAYYRIVFVNVEACMDVQNQVLGVDACRWTNGATAHDQGIVGVLVLVDHRGSLPAPSAQRVVNFV